VLEHDVNTLHKLENNRSVVQQMGILRARFCQSISCHNLTSTQFCSQVKQFRLPASSHTKSGDFPSHLWSSFFICTFFNQLIAAPPRLTNCKTHNVQDRKNLLYHRKEFSN